MSSQLQAGFLSPGNEVSNGTALTRALKRSWISPSSTPWMGGASPNPCPLTPQRREETGDDNTCPRRQAFTDCYFGGVVGQLSSCLGSICLKVKDGGNAHLPATRVLPALEARLPTGAGRGGAGPVPGAWPVPGAGLEAPRGPGGPAPPSRAPRALRAGAPRSCPAFQCRSRPPAARNAPPPRQVSAPLARPAPCRPRPAPPRRGRSTAPRGPKPAKRLPAGALNGAAGPGARDPPRRAAAPDGCRRGGRAWMRREPEASSSRRRLCPWAPYGLKVSADRVQDRRPGPKQGQWERRRELEGRRGWDQKFVRPLWRSSARGPPCPALPGLSVGPLPRGRR